MKTVVVFFKKDFDLKVGRYRQSIELIKVCENARSRSFFDLGPSLFAYENQNLLCFETTRSFLTKC